MKQDPMIVVRRMTAQPTGCTRAEFRWKFDCGEDRDRALEAFDLALKAGEIVPFISRKAGASGRPCTRYFQDATAGRAWQLAYAGLQAKPNGAKARAKMKALSDQTEGKAWRNLVERPAGGEPVCRGDVKVTVCPSAPVYSRHQVVPGQTVPSVISARDARPWAAAASAAQRPAQAL